MHRMLVVLLALGACKSEKPAATAEPGSPGSAAVPTAPTPPPSQPAAPAAPAPSTTGTKVGFNVNGVAAETAPKADDKDEEIASYQLANKHVAFSVYGDVPGSPRRGFVTIGIDNWNGELGEVKGNAQFSRYLDKSDGKSIVWGKRGAATLTFTSLVEGEKNPVGREFRAAGTFKTAPLDLALGYKSDVTTIELTEGTFENLRVQYLGKPKP